jgi:uncharacterized protein (DUF433 family)
MEPRLIVHTEPEILGGTPVFVGTRLPLKTLFDHLEAGDSLAEFLYNFPGVSPAQAVAALELAERIGRPRRKDITEQDGDIGVPAQYRVSALRSCS